MEVEKLKKIISILVVIAMVGIMMAGCNNSSTKEEVSSSPESTSNSETNESSNEKISVISTIFAPYDFVREVAGDNAGITMLLPPAAESHSFEPTPQDIIKIQDCDVFIYVGGDSDAWVDEVLESLDTSNMKIISLMDTVSVVEEETVEGMESDHGHSHGDEEIDPANVTDRPLSDFNGKWISGIPLINDGSLDAYLSHAAEKEEITLDEKKKNTLEKWASEYDNIEIKDNKLIINGNESEYSAKGYEIVEGDHGTSVWYKYEISTPIESMPTYLIFNDHQYTSHDEHEEEHDDEHDEHEEIAHFHIRFGNESFEALISSEDPTPYYFDSSYTGEEIGEFMSGHSHETEYDEHVWTSPKNAKIIVQKISDTLCESDSQNSDIYKQNTTAYLEKLDKLDKDFQEVVDNAVRKTLIFGDRFPFRYFVDAYGLDYYAAFPGCSTETEASASTVAFLIDKVKAENIPVVFHAELSNEKMANTISESTDAKILLLHACHNVSKDEFEKGVSYIDLMNQNVQNLKEALQ